MLATCIHMMQGTPYVYQGEELGMFGTRPIPIIIPRDNPILGDFHLG